MAKHQYLIKKYLWKSSNFFMKLSTKSAFLFSNTVPKMKTWD